MRNQSVWTLITNNASLIIQELMNTNRIISTAVTAVIMTGLVTCANAQKVYNPVYALQQRCQIDWHDLTEQELNLQQDTRNLTYAVALGLCGLYMNNRGNDRNAIAVAGGIGLVATFDNARTIIRRNIQIRKQ